MSAKASHGRSTISDAQRMWDALKQIAAYQTPDRLRKTAGQCGLLPEEHIEMAYENMIAEAKAAIKGMRRPA